MATTTPTAKDVDPVKPKGKGEEADPIKDFDLMTKDEKKKFLMATLNMDERDFEAASELKELTMQSAFGFTPAMAIDVAQIMINEVNVPYNLILAAITAVGQVKKNVTTNELMRKFESIFELSTSNKDGAKSVNFHAVRMVGMLFCKWVGTEIDVVTKISEKAGNVWVTNRFPDTDAGNINKELYGQFKEWKAPELSKESTRKLIDGLKLWYKEGQGSFAKEVKDKYITNLKAAMKKS